MFGIKSFTDLLTDIYNMHPKSRMTGFYQFSTPFLMIKDPELIKQITVKDFDYFTDHQPFVDPEIDPLWGNNLISLKGQRWREMRATLSGSFTSSKMKHMFGVISEVSENFVQYFLDQKQKLFELEMKDTYSRYTNDVIASSAFGIQVNSVAEPENTFYTMGKTITNLDGFLIKTKFILFFLVPKLFAALKVSIFDGEATAFFRNIIHETVHVREEKGIVRQDMVHLLLEARKGNSNEEDITEAGFAAVLESTDLDKYHFKQLKKLTDDDIAAQAMGFFFAGFDTVATALCFGTYELAINKGVQDTLRKEIDETHRANNGQLTYDVLLRMKYMDMVLKEILRKWAPVSGIDRICTKSYTIQPVHPDETPIELKIGDTIFLPMHALQRDPKYYPEPEKFNPERFSDENKDNITPYTFIPFGSGPRNCIGSRFAILETKVLLYNLLLNFEIVPTKRTRIPLKIDPKSFQSTAEGGFWLGLKRIRT